MLDLTKIDSTWTLFLDRDGVINHERYQQYVLHYPEFVFNDGVLDALVVLASRFGRIVVVTNQRGVEKKLMTEEALLDVHEKMLAEVEAHGGRIDAIYYCTSLDDHHPNRKPQTGMALMAKERFPEIDFSSSIMVGNTLSDMAFGKTAGMKTVFVQTTSPTQSLPHPDIDVAFKNLPAFTFAITSIE